MRYVSYIVTQDITIGNDGQRVNPGHLVVSLPICLEVVTMVVIAIAVVRLSNSQIGLDMKVPNAMS